MRFAVAALLALSASAHADVFRKRTLGRSLAGPPAISNVLYLNDCRPNGCAVQPGFDDARSNHSSIPVQPAMLDAWGHGDAFWDELVACVRQTFRPFQVDIVTSDPGPAVDHFEVMIGGRWSQLSIELENAGGVAPFLGCGATENNVISFVFAGQSKDLEYLCGAVAQEAAHVWGLDHELNALDPMTYLDLGSLKRFQNTASPCGERLGQERECFCGGATQNSYAYLEALFGATELPAASVAITSPGDGAWVKPGFPVHVMIDSVLGGTSATLQIDGVEHATLSPGPFAFNAPATLPGGPHEVTAIGFDGGNRSATRTITVNVTAACSASSPCRTGQHCLGGFCLPGPEVEGGLGAECLGNSGCITGACASGNGQQLCVAPCEPGDRCPAGFYCVEPQATRVCWPEQEGSCSSSKPVHAWWLVLALIVQARRRRRCPRMVRRSSSAR